MSAVKQVGLMVEVALVGAEETEWHRRFHEAGWKVVFHPGAEVIHYGSQTVGGETSSLLPEYLKGALYFFRTSRSAAAYAMFRSALVAMFNAKLVAQRVAGNEKGIAITRRYLEVTRDAAGA
jgi:GT2 family glycosyltransferase